MEEPTKSYMATNYIMMFAVDVFFFLHDIHFFSICKAVDLLGPVTRKTSIINTGTSTSFSYTQIYQDMNLWVCCVLIVTEGR